MSARDSFVYRIYHRDGTLLYVGCTKHLRNRWQQHYLHRPGLKLVASRFKVSGPYARATALRLEREALINEQPLLGRIPGSPLTVDRVRNEHIYRTLSVLDGPTKVWHAGITARPLANFPGWWRCFSDGEPTAIVSDADIADFWDLCKGAAS